MDLCLTITQSVAGIVGAVVAIVACILSYRSYRSQESLSQKQLDLSEHGEQRDEQRYAQQVDATATAFLQRNQTERLLIPLCEVAYRYNKSKAYRRGIYRNYCALPEDVRKRILDREGLATHIPEAEGDALFNLALGRVESLFPTRDDGVFYDNGKYFKRAIEDYGDAPLFADNHEYEKDYGALASRLIGGKKTCHLYNEQMLDILSRGDIDVSAAIKFLEEEYGFGIIDDHGACQFATELAWLLVFFKGDGPEPEGCGCPEDFLCQEKVYMEDSFLFALYKICLHTDWNQS